MRLNTVNCANKAFTQHYKRLDAL